MLQVLDLFSGIGGFSLGLERTGGFETVGFCEIEPFCQKVLAKHWPDVPIYPDITELTGERLKADGIKPDVLSGGFPCQDISVAGRGEGIEGERSGLWREFARLVGEIRPQYAIVENSSALTFRGLGRVLGDLASFGYDTEWEAIPAAAVGAPHIRDRIWILAYPGRELRDIRTRKSQHGRDDILPRRNNGQATERCHDWELVEMVPGVHPRVAKDWWRHQSGVARTADGLPGQLDRIAGCGNSVVPQIPELIGRALLESRVGA